MDDFTNAQPGAASQPSIANQTRIVRFAKQPSVRNVESIWTASASGSLSMADQRFQTFASNEVSDEMMREAATLFSENYGIWGERSEKSGEYTSCSILVLCLRSHLLHRHGCHFECSTSAAAVPS